MQYRKHQPFLMALNWIANNMDIIDLSFWAWLWGLVFGLWLHMERQRLSGFDAAAGVWAALCALNPATLMVIGVIALVAVLYAGVAAFNKLTGSSVSATGIISAALYTLGAFAYNSFIYPTWKGFAMLANFVGNVIS